MFHFMNGTHGHVSCNESTHGHVAHNTRHMWPCFMQCLDTHGDVLYTDWHTL